MVAIYICDQIFNKFSMSIHPSYLLKHQYRRNPMLHDYFLAPQLRVSYTPKQKNER
jgi:hypothetical protein